MANYTAFNGASNNKAFSIPATDHMSDVRTQLTAAGFMTESDSFLYENPVTGLKTVLGPRSAEATARLSACLWPAVPDQGFANQLIQIVSLAGSNPSFLGSQPSSGWLHNSPIFGVSVTLNSEFSANNAGMFQPLMLQNVQSADPNNPVSFSQCVIVQKGAIVTLNISSWGGFGYGYSVTSNMSVTNTDIVPVAGLYRVWGSSPPPKNMGYSSISRYANGFKPNGDSIQIKSNASLGIAKQYNVEYSTVTFASWNLSKATFDGTTHTCTTPIPTGVADAGSGFDPGKKAPPAGGTSVPSGGTQPGSTSAGPPSSQKFGGPMTWPYEANKKPATRADGLIGSMEVYFLVFTSKEDANNIIRVLNSPTLGIP